MNIKKCEYVVDNKKDNFRLALAGQVLEETTEHFYLGISIAAYNVKFNGYENFLPDKVIRAVGAVKGLMKIGYNRYEIKKDFGQQKFVPV